jgi:hypothetical protein
MCLSDPLSLWQIPERKGFKGGKLCFGSWFWRFQSEAGCIVALHWGETKHQGHRSTWQRQPTSWQPESRKRQERAGLPVTLLPATRPHLPIIPVMMLVTHQGIDISQSAYDPDTSQWLILLAGDQAFNTWALGDTSHPNHRKCCFQRLSVLPQVHSQFPYSWIAFHFLVAPHFFIFSAIDEHSGGFGFLVMTSNSDVNICDRGFVRHRFCSPLALYLGESCWVMGWRRI